MAQNSVSKKAGESQSVMHDVPKVASSVLLSLSSSKRSCIENPMEATGILARRRFTKRAIECDLCNSLKAMVSSKTDWLG